MSNSSSTTQFLLLAFADTRELQLLHFWLSLGIYLAALLANGLIITTVACDHHLHTPMYFFLLNLSFLDLGSISTTVPKAMANSLWHTRAISYPGCAAQVFLFVFLISAEYFLLTVMAYDRYAAICKPLQDSEEENNQQWMRIKSGYLSKLTPFAGLYPRVLREPANAIVRTLCIILEWGWRLGEVPDDLQRTRDACIFQQGPKDELGN
ncbi:olfactory receptor 14I1-like [Aquila chrysaetos chrysaetos]|uniref:olfactory receptor 14I1-like n=1 Tax=Aquila chrysaetos chrysaetos TaxID=223781 RepID=UPI001B7D30EA|nr:olfactory receptor 14I1-like [Aquila chrysaetos chrysaetos]